jgi:hypothetical protein
MGYGDFCGGFMGASQVTGVKAPIGAAIVRNSRYHAIELQAGWSLNPFSWGIFHGDTFTAQTLSDAYRGLYPDPQEEEPIPPYVQKQIDDQFSGP